MNGFAALLEGIDRQSLSRRIEAAGSDDVRRVLRGRAQGSGVSSDDIPVLVSEAAGELLEEMAGLARDITVRRFGRVVQLYAPLYISNYCRNACLYCGFNVNNRVARRTLSLDEVMEEARRLHGQGIHQILLVSGDCPDVVSVDMLAEMAGRLKKLFPSVAIEIYPLGEAEYRRLYGAGVDGLAIYQETYNREVYRQVHPTGPKRDFDFRLAAPERGGAAGFRQLGIGALLGLDDWRLEACLLAHHAAYLTKHYWRSQVSISFPRLRPAAGGFQPPHPVTDRQLAQMICALRLALPDVGLVLSTRESPDFRDNMAGVGVTRMSAGSKTSPGGYLDKLGGNLDGQGQSAEEQFSVDDNRSVAEVALAIRARGFDTVWKDWDRGFEG